MAAMPEVIAKGPILKRLEARYRDRVKLQDRLTALKDSSDDVATLGRQRGVLTEVEAEHLRKDWFSRDGWWPHAYPIEPILRHGLIVALEEAVKRSLPIDAYWVCSSPHNSFQVNITWSEQQLTVIFNSPPVPAEYQDNPLASDATSLVTEQASSAMSTRHKPQHPRRRPTPEWLNAEEPIIAIKRIAKEDRLETDRVLCIEYSDEAQDEVKSYIIAVEPKNLLTLEQGMHPYEPKTKRTSTRVS
ncbi:MAG: hypothetical protein HY268_26120 [Deltaproteobacteria bacterium]|nr:hypothetical protein [Deltaproteobacteria bacterium]